MCDSHTVGALGTVVDRTVSTPLTRSLSLCRQTLRRLLSFPRRAIDIGSGGRRPPALTRFLLRVSEVAPCRGTGSGGGRKDHEPAWRMESKRLLVRVQIERSSCKVAPFPKTPKRMTSRRFHRVRPFVSGSPATGKSFGPWLCVAVFRQLCPFQRASQASVANQRYNYSYYRIKHRNDQQTNVPLLQPNRR